MPGTNGAWDSTGALSGSDPSFFTLSNGDKSATAPSSSGSAFIGSTNTNLSGKYYLEITCNKVGTAIDDLIGVVDNSIDGILVQPNGEWYLTGNQGSPNVASFTTGAIIGIAVDLTNLLFWIRTNNGDWNNNGTANPATGTGGLALTITPPASALFGLPGAANAEYTINTGTTAFAYTPPSGFANWYGVSSYQPYVLMALFQGGRHS